MCVLAVVLSVAGGLCELGGLGLVVLGIARDREQARRLFVPRPRRRRPKRSYPPHGMPRTYPGYPGPFSSGGSSELRKIVEYVSKVDAAAHNNFIDMRKVLDAGIEDTVDLLRTEAANADDDLRGHLRYVLAGSIEDRMRGAILLAVGIVLAAAGSVIGTVSG
jgi:hypothetical protein